MSVASERVFDVGPMLPATHTLRCLQLSAACRAMAAPSMFIRAARCAMPYSFCEMRLAPNVLVVMMSAPASM